MNNQTLTETQKTRLAEVLPYTLNTPFYKHKIQMQVNEAKDIDPFKLLNTYPFTYKQEIRSVSHTERTTLSQQEILAYFSSSGSTGEPSVYAWSNHDQEVYNEIAKRILNMLGVGPGDVALLSVPFGMPLSGFGMMTEMQAVGATFIPFGAVPLDKIARALIDYPVTILKINPIIASRLIRYIREKDASILKKLRLRQIHLVGYPASPARRHRLETEWGVKCYGVYGMSEIGLLAGECSVRDGGQHLCADYILAEVVDSASHQPLPPENVGVGVYTTLWKKGSPLLRYWSDDYFSMRYEPCSCGNSFPKLFLKGRDVDSAVLSGKRFFVSEIEDLLFSDEWIGNEFLVKLLQKDAHEECIVEVESQSSSSIRRCIQDKIEEFLGIRTTINLIPNWPADRLTPKPVRIIDRRTAKE